MPEICKKRCVTHIISLLIKKYNKLLTPLQQVSSIRDVKYDLNC